MENQGNIWTGLIWGSAISIVLWMAIIGWLEILF